MALVQQLTVNDTSILVKFDKFVKVTSLVNSAFTLVDTMNNNISFEPIDQFDDYNSISRLLTLTYNEPTFLPAGTYTFTISGLLDAANSAFPDYVTTFTAGDATPSPIIPPLPDPILITDKSIRSKAYMSSQTILVSNPDFYIIDTDPVDGELFMPTDYNSGRMTIRFSTAPDSSTLNPQYFKVQRKKIQRLPARWETVPVHISIDHIEPWVYIDFPSTDATPVYTTPGTNYFDPGYKYRIIVSKNIGA